MIASFVDKTPVSGDTLFNRVKTELSLLIKSTASDAQVEAYLHETELQYEKAKDNHQTEYPAYALEHLKTLVPEQIDAICVKYERYKVQQTARIEAVRFFEEQVMPQLKFFTRQPLLGYHGLEHTEFVALRAIDIAISLGYEKQSELVPVLLAAAIHDCARGEDEGDEQLHGKQAAAMPEVHDFLSQSLFKLSDLQKTQIKDAAAYHTSAMPDDGNSYDYITLSLCDGDRVRLSWEEGYKEKYYFTAKGKELGAMNPNQVLDYLQDWDELLENNGVTPLYGELTQKYYIPSSRKCVFFLKEEFRQIKKQ